MRPSIKLGIALALAGVTSGGAAQSKPGDPEEVVRAFWEAALAQRWADAVAFLDLTILARMRATQLENARRPQPQPTVEDLLRRDPTMPREAAEYQIRSRARLLSRQGANPFPEFFGIDSSAQLERMPMEEVAARWLQAQDPVWRMMELRRSRSCAPLAEHDSSVASRRPEVFGHVMAGRDSAFVLFRPAWMPRAGMPGDFRAFSPPNVAVVVRRPEGWRIRAAREPQGGFFTAINLNPSDCPAPPRIQ